MLNAEFVWLIAEMRSMTNALLGTVYAMSSIHPVPLVVTYLISHAHNGLPAITDLSSHD